VVDDAGRSILALLRVTWVAELLRRVRTPLCA